MSTRLQKDLDQALDLFKRIDKLIVSDEYPPFTTGGAEISLHELITHEQSRAETLIVKFTNPRSVIRYYRYQSVHVLELPASNLWRLSGQPLFELTEKRHSLPAPVSRFIRMTWDAGRWGYLLWMSKRSYTHFCVTMLHLGRLPRGGVLMDSIEEQYAQRADLLNRVLDRLRPSTLIANNTRSIVTGYYARRRSPSSWQGMQTLAMVRDNRFACPRFNQIMRVAGRSCTTCVFDCAREDVRLLTRLQKHLLERTANTRRQALASYDVVTVTSRYLMQQISGFLPSECKIRLVPNFVSSPSSSTSPAPVPAPDGRDTLAIIGSINEAKGQLEFIQNSLEQLRRHPGLTVAIIGKGERLQKRLKQLLEREQLRGRVRFTGFLDRDLLFREIQKSSIVVLPTLWPEPFGRVPLEAGLSSRPVVSFKTGGLVESIRDGETGYLVDTEDYEGLWARILSLLGDRAKLQQMGNANLELTCQRYSADRTLKALQEALTLPS